MTFEIFECGTRLGGDLGANPITLPFRQGTTLIGTRLRFEGLTRRVKLLDGTHPDAGDPQHLSDLAAGQTVLGQSNNAVTELDGKRFHRPTLLGWQTL